MPWERERAVRMLNWLTLTALVRLQTIRWLMMDERQGVIQYVKPNFAGGHVDDFFEVAYFDNLPEATREPPEAKVDWLATTHPNLEPIGDDGINAASELVQFEARRRGTMLVLAIESYRLKHGALPKSLGELVGPYFREMPLDPYSGLEFRYFPAGLPQSAVSPLADGSIFIEPITPVVPCVWSTGSDLWVETVSEESAGESHAAKSSTTHDGEKLVYHFRSGRDRQLSRTTVWQRGLWFPIPEQRR